ncbi:hypothetical protein M8J75_000191 [Diaphorina citri]|nr:hypothetical protein M8J75_000191 [Diaphorina citri]
MSDPNGRRVRRGISTKMRLYEYLLKDRPYEICRLISSIKHRTPEDEPNHHNTLSALSCEMQCVCLSANMFDHRGLRFYICTVFYYALMYLLYKYSSKLDYCAQDQDLMPHT